jgi:hypothetical protein
MFLLFVTAEHTTPQNMGDTRKSKERVDGEMVAGRVKPVDPETAKVVPVAGH